MKIGIYVTGAKWPPGKDTIVSGHVQIPLKTASLLLERGHKVTLITTEAPTDYRIPPVVALPGLNVKTVTKASRDWPHKGFDPLKAVKQFFELRRVVKNTCCDVLHFFGAENTGYLAGLLKATRAPGHFVMSFINFRHSADLNLRRQGLLRRIDRFATSTAHTRGCLTEAGLGPVSLIRPGLVKSFSRMKGQTIRIRPAASSMVLFWRNANEQNGADVCLEAFQRLSGLFPRTDFVFAVRPSDQLEDALRRAADQVENIHLLLHPYPAGITIGDLICSASCVVLPFRSLTMNPQLAVLETLSAGAPLITTPVESNAELIQDGETGFLVPASDIEEVSSRIRYVLLHPSEAERVGRRAADRVEKTWDWTSYVRGLEELYGQLLCENERREGEYA